jgi:hypothetical protein
VLCFTKMGCAAVGETGRALNPDQSVGMVSAATMFFALPPEA